MIVENHPRLCGPKCLEFQRQLQAEFEIALGLETVHPEVLPRLNKRMTVADFDRAAEFLTRHGIAVRTFVLLQPPFLDAGAGEEWYLRSLEHAFAAGARVCSVIATRGGNGIMEKLEQDGLFHPPRLDELERVLVEALSWRRGRVFADLWDVERFARCPHCAGPRVERLRRMNHSQSVLPPVACGRCTQQ